MEGNIILMVKEKTIVKEFVKTESTRKMGWSKNTCQFSKRHDNVKNNYCKIYK